MGENYILNTVKLQILRLFLMKFSDLWVFLDSFGFGFFFKSSVLVKLQIISTLYPVTRYVYGGFQMASYNKVRAILILLNTLLEKFPKINDANTLWQGDQTLQNAERSSLTLDP